MTPSRLGGVQTSLRVQWVNEAPSGWKVVPAKALFIERREPSRRDDVHLTPSQSYGVLEQQEYMRVTGTRVVLNLAGGDSMRHVEPDDFVIHLRSFQGGIERSRLRGKVSAAYTVLTLRNHGIADFYRWVLKASGYVQVLQTTTNQLRDGQSIRYGDFAKVELPVPPLEEQRAIADYLDRETARIDKLIAKQDRLIETLRERRAATVADLVMGGSGAGAEARTDVPAWLPPTPEQWNVLQLGLAVDTLAGFAFPSDGFSFDTEHVGLIRGVNVKPGAVDWSDAVYWDTRASPISSAYALSVGDLVLGMDRPLVAGGTRIAAVQDCDLPALLVQRVLRLRTPNPSFQSYLRYLFSTQAFATYIAPAFSGVSVPHMSEWQVRKFVIPRPPDDELISIVRELEAQTSKIDLVIAKTQRFIELSRERRSALITAAVTGQIDVREAS